VVGVVGPLAGLVLVDHLSVVVVAVVVVVGGGSRVKEGVGR